jgi:hypothetical protein
MFKIPDFIGSFYYYPDTKAFSWKGVFGMFIQERTLLTDGSESIKGQIGDNFGNSTFEGIINNSYIEFTKKYDLKSIEIKGASETPIYYRGTKDSIGDYIGYWTQNLDVPFDKLLPYDKVGFFIKSQADAQRMKIMDSGRETEIWRNIKN